MEKTTRDSYSWLLLYIVLTFVKITYQVGAVIWTFLGAVAVTKTVEGSTGIVLAFCTLNWLGWISYVGFQQMDFTLDKLLLRDDTAKTE